MQGHQHVNARLGPFLTTEIIVVVVPILQLLINWYTPRLPTGSVGAIYQLFLQPCLIPLAPRIPFLPRYDCAAQHNGIMRSISIKLYY